MFSNQGFAGRGPAVGGAAARVGSNFTQGGGGNFGATQQGASPQGGKGKQTQPIRPVTIKQLLNAQRVGDGVTVIDGREATQVTVLGRVVDFEGSAAMSGGTAKHHGYRISDGTGLLVVRQWLDADKKIDLLPVGAYVRASGSVKVWQEKPLITGTVRLVSDCNEFTYHLLDAALTHLRITRGPVPVIAAAPTTANQAASFLHSAATPAAASGTCYDAVMRVITQHACNPMSAAHGLTREDVVGQTQREGYTIDDVQKVLKAMQANGTIFYLDNTRFQKA